MRRSWTCWPSGSRHSSSVELVAGAFALACCATARARGRAMRGRRCARPRAGGRPRRRGPTALARSVAGGARAAGRRQDAARATPSGAGGRGAARQPGGLPRRWPTSGWARSARDDVEVEARQAAQQQAIEGMVAPVRASLEKFDEQIRAMELARGTAYGELRQQLKTVTETQEKLHDGDRQPGQRAEGAGGARALGRDAAPPRRRAGRHARRTATSTSR